jgi:hypothetical protein
MRRAAPATDPYRAAGVWATENGASPRTGWASHCFLRRARAESIPPIMGPRICPALAPASLFVPGSRSGCFSILRSGGAFSAGPAYRTSERMNWNIASLALGRSPAAQPATACRTPSGWTRAATRRAVRPSAYRRT